LHPALETIPAQPTATAAKPGATRGPVVLLVLALAVLWLVCCRHLSEEWRFNEQYSYGWFVPFFTAYLFWLRWDDRPPKSRVLNFRFQISTLVGIAMIALILFPLRIFEVASSDYRPLGWLHAFIVITITLSIIYLIGGAAWQRHFAFPVLFFLTAVPWVTAIEAPIIEGLMRGVAAIAAEVLALFGIPAEAQGNLLKLPIGLIGVNEACSGVRSLQTSIMVGLLFGELKRLSAGRRIVLVAAAVAVALFANFLRVLFLVSTASNARDVSVVDKWHDTAGYAILVLVFAGTMLVAWRLSRPRETTRPQDNKTTRHQDNGTVRQEDRGPAVSGQWSVVRGPSSALFALCSLLLLAWLVAVEIGVEAWYRMHERDAMATPAWSVRWPQNANGYREIKTDERVRELLRYDSAHEAIWHSGNLQNYMFFFRWNAGSGTILRARAHRPDVCLPSAGWKELGPARLETFPTGPGHSLSFRRFTFGKIENGELPVRAHAYYCLHEDRVHEAEKDLPDLYSNWDLTDRLRVVKHGIRNLGQQVLEIIIVAPAHIDDAVIDGQFQNLLHDVVVVDDDDHKTTGLQDNWTTRLVTTTERP
jgi:exosortase